MEDVPIITKDQCRVDLTSSKNENATEHDGDLTEYRHWSFIKRHKLIYLVQGYIYAARRIDEINERGRLTIDAPSLEDRTTNPILQDLYRHFYKSQLHERNNSSELRSIVPMDRSRRDLNKLESPCKLNMEYCKKLINSMWSIASIVNNSMPHLQSFLKNFPAETTQNATKSKFVELVECLQCKNDSITFIDDTGADNLAHYPRTMLEHSDNSQIRNNVGIVSDLLNDERHGEEENLRANLEIEPTTMKTTVAGENVETTSESGWKADTGEIQTTLKTPSPSETMEHSDKNVVTEATVINARTSIQTTPKAEDTTTRMDEQTIGIGDTNRSVVTVNVTAKPDDNNVTKITIDPVHHSVHTLSQGQQPLMNEQKETQARDAESWPTFRDVQGRIVNKGNIDSGPTAETMKSSQQLQLTPTMSWVPYQVCFYGTDAHNPTKQSTAGQAMYSASSPAIPYPPAMSQLRQGFQNFNQPSGYIQVQATAQLLPMQPSLGNFGPSVGQRIGLPTGPAIGNYPTFPSSGGMLPSAAANSNGKTPYYCTYIPAPTFQFPPIPGVPDYQRSSVPYEEAEETDNSVESKGDEKNFLFGTCPSSMIQCGDNGRCIARSQWCDGIVDCNNAIDETSCSCRERISQERLCDGYFDCPYGEDELECLGCPKNTFSCNDWQQQYTTVNCVPFSQRCDGVRQCANGKDETDCNVLTPSYNEGNKVFTIGYTEGYLHKNYKGQWYPVCTAIDAWVKDACVSEIGLETSDSAEITIRSMPRNVYQGPYLTQVNNQLKLIPSCMNRAVFVRCARFPCGTTVFSREDTMRPHALEKEDQQPLQVADQIVWPLYVNKIDSKRGENEKRVARDQDDMVGSQLRVVGGRASHPKAWPFLVAVYKEGIFYCGGVILSELWVLTAAHCLDGYAGQYFEIQAGVLRRNSFSPMSQFRRARYMILHSQYDPRSMRNDIAMIMLDDPLRFNRWVRPICLPGPDLLGPMWRNKPEPNSTCIAIGWGAVKEFGENPDHLREVEVPILASCKYEDDRNDAVICAGYPQGGRDACQGDSGGPLLCRNPYSESQWYVAGVISHGEGCARPNDPGAYTRVSYFVDWIREISSGRGASPLKRTPLQKCSGFSCDGGLGKCLPIEARCNRIVDCLGGEDEMNCNGRYPLYEQSDNTTADFERRIVSTTMDVDVSTMSNEIVTGKLAISNNLIHHATDKSMSMEQEMKSMDDKLTSTTSGLENRPSSTPTTTPAIFICTRLLQTIPIEKRCDRAVDCEDGTDEMNCTCRDFLEVLKPSAVCNGYADCDDLTDEQNCALCAEDEFLCRKNRACIPMAKKCDGKFDCYYKEDELDCFTLTDDQRVYLDGDGLPFLNEQGYVTKYYPDGNWKTTCHRPKVHHPRNQSTVVLIGENICIYFGFKNHQSSESVDVRNSKLETIVWQKGKPTYQVVEYSSAASLNQHDKTTCPGLYVHCSPTLGGSMFAHLVTDASTGSRDYLWPWLAAIFVDGRHRCVALLLDPNWLLSAAKCLENTRLDANYVTAVLGFGRSFRHLDGPHQQISIVDELHPVNNSVAVLLHLKERVRFSRYVRPLFVNKTIYPAGAMDTCVAVGTSDDHEMKSAFVRPVLQNCPSCQRCFASRISSSECWGNETSNWSGTIFCRSRKGWYPASVFQHDREICNFESVRNTTSIEHVNPYLTQAIDGPRHSVEPTVCNGFRCNVGQCIPQSRVCDGVPDCRGREDEDSNYCGPLRENCEHSVDGCVCTKTELRCRNGKCVDKSAFCDGNVDCPDGSDEPTICTCAEYLKLTSPERLCDGVRHCLDKTDESPEMCPCRDSSFKCKTTTGNNTCIPQDFICDGLKDCSDGEDEATCRVLIPSSNDRNNSGEVFRRSYGVWHTECFPNPVVHEEDSASLCKSMGYSSGTVDNVTMIADEPRIPKQDEFHIVKLNQWSWMALRNDKPLITLEKSNGICHRAFVTCF
ncbi:serine protease nudel-like isoform X2 [Frieseomelitta varia]|uniref:serine protease nudel-like isoform X2 n=1 Tax=Frieseomelitta varia TaxID=561572 RepID=UPI001CB67B78|nr:serine protease nudel-like isoform X2 [Frieseomelitta varia]